MPPTEEQVKIIEEKFGIRIRPQEKENTIDIFIKKLDLLQQMGVDVSNMLKLDTIETLLKKSNISIENLPEELKKGDKIGNSLTTVRSAYSASLNNKKGKGILPTEEQVKIIEEKFGIRIRPQEKENTIDIFIKKLDLLQQMGVDVSNMLKLDTIETLLKKSNISIENLPEELKKGDKIGSSLSIIRAAYKTSLNNKKSTNGYIPPTEDQVKIIEEKLGIRIKPKIKIRSIEEATYKTPAEKSVEANRVVHTLIKRKKI